MRNRSQLVLPIDLGIKIAEDDPVRKLVEICEELDYTELYRKYVRNIVSDEGVLLRVNRSIQVEGAFGILKQDCSFRRFLFRGKRNIEMQFFLLAFAFNIHKLCNRIKNHRVLHDLFIPSNVA